MTIISAELARRVAIAHAVQHSPELQLIMSQIDDRMREGEFHLVRGPIAPNTYEVLIALRFQVVRKGRRTTISFI